MTLAEMRARVRSVVRDTGGNFITDTDIKNWLNDGYVDVVARLRLLLKVASVDEIGEAGTSVADGTIDLPSDFVHATSLRFGIDDAENATSEDFWAWEDSGSTPANTQYMVFADKIYLYPKPSSGTAFKLRYVYRPTLLSADGDSPAIAAEHHMRLVHFAQWQAKLKEDAVGQADRYLSLYESGLPPLTPSKRLSPGPLQVTVEPNAFDLDMEARHL